MVAPAKSLSVLTTLILSIAPFVAAHGLDSDYAKRGDANRRHAAAFEAAEAARLLAARATGAPIATPTAPPLSLISSGMPTETPSSLFTSYAPGATAPIPGATSLPAFVKNLANYPTPDKLPPTNSPELAPWMEKLKAANIPNNPITHDGDCASQPDPSAAGSCWWTCGGCTRETDIVSCPDKNTWGVSYDDGPSEYTPKLLDYLYATNQTATFFVVGSRSLYRPEILQAEYMLGHSLSVHTWSHPALTTLTNEEIVAELGWTMIVIKHIVGVTPNTFRPPYGDMDDRVRAVAKVMGLTPIMWTGFGEQEFDTADWKVAQGAANATTSLSAFEKILDLASQLTTGFVVLQHDLYQVTVDLGIGVFMPLAKQRNFLAMAIHECLHKPLASFYMETSGDKNVIIPGPAGGAGAPAGGNKTGGTNTSLRPTGTGTASLKSSTTATVPSSGAARRSTDSSAESVTGLLGVVVVSLGLMGFGARLLF